MVRHIMGNMHAHKEIVLYLVDTPCTEKKRKHGSRKGLTCWSCWVGILRYQGWQSTWYNQWRPSVVLQLLWKWNCFLENLQNGLKNMNPFLSMCNSKTFNPFAHVAAPCHLSFLCLVHMLNTNVSHTCTCAWSLVVLVSCSMFINYKRFWLESLEIPYFDLVFSILLIILPPDI